MNTKKKPQPSKPASSSLTPTVSEATTEETPQSSTEKHLMEIRGFQGPMPPPEILQGYEDVIKGAAERILVMTERQSTHRQNLEKGEQDIRGGAIKRGQWMGYSIALIAISMGFYLSLTGSEVFGFWLILSTIGSLVAVFLANFFMRNGREN